LSSSSSGCLTSCFDYRSPPLLSTLALRFWHCCVSFLLLVFFLSSFLSFFPVDEPFQTSSPFSRIVPFEASSTRLCAWQKGELCTISCAHFMASQVMYLLYVFALRQLLLIGPRSCHHLALPGTHLSNAINGPHINAARLCALPVPRVADVSMSVIMSRWASFLPVEITAVCTAGGTAGGCTVFRTLCVNSGAVTMAGKKLMLRCALCWLFDSYPSSSGHRPWYQLTGQ